MATKRVKKVVKSEACCAPVPAGEYKPRLYLSVEGQDVSQIKDLKVGEKVEILVTGKVVGLSQRERPDYGDTSKTKKTGDIDLEGYRVEVLGDEEDFGKKTGTADDED